jgi:uncharacterized protein
MEYIIIAICAFLASLVTFYSGFGLGTILMPIVAIFFPLPIAISLTAVVHMLNNLLKAGLLLKNIDWKVAFQFGGAAILAAIPGAWLLQKLSFLPPLKKYTLFSISGEISILHLAIGILLIFIATAELFPNKFFKIKNLFLGGALSGFFGGLSGNQGAIRSIFLVHSSLSKEAFIGTNAAIAAAVDIIRLSVYGLSFGQLLTRINIPLLFTTMCGAVLGVCIGMFFLKQMTINIIQKIIICLLYFLGILLAVGII